MIANEELFTEDVSAQFGFSGISKMKGAARELEDYGLLDSFAWGVSLHLSDVWFDVSLGSWLQHRLGCLLGVWG